ncbi:MAG: (Fe-S)-binding protein [Rhodothermales bacterium]
MPTAAPTVGLFVPCYIDQLYPQVAVATLRVLEAHGCRVVYPPNQTCCGQPMANAGFEHESHATMRHFVKQFAEMDYIVAPSGSCVLHVREHYDALDQTPAVTHVRKQTYELCQFLVEVLKIEAMDAHFPYRVGLHAACHGLRGLHLGLPSERRAAPFDHVRQVLGMVEGLELVELARRDECCGFGGTFAVAEEAVSVKMGRDRLRDHEQHGAEVIVSTDMSCLMHLQGLAKREQRPVRFAHVAEVLVEDAVPA